MFKIEVISPDFGSGVDFLKTLRRSGLKKVCHNVVSIPPRVEQGKLTKNVKGVVKALARAMIDIGANTDAKFLTISCNTLSLSVFVDEAFEMFGKFFKNDNKINLILTVDEIRKYLKNNKNKKVFILGTKPLSQMLSDDKKYNFPTLSNMEGSTEKDLDLVQEIIWRVKADQGSDVDKNLDYKVSLNDKEANLREIKKSGVLLKKLFILLKIEEVIMGCTELPTAFNIMNEEIFGDGCLKLKLVDPAMLVSEAIKKWGCKD
jgi:aspartate/glutamate racemase